MTEVLEVRFRVRRGLTADWASLNPVLLDSEIGRESDSDPVRIKIGDGVTAWNDLPYFTGDLTGVLTASDIDTDSTLAADSDAKVPSQKAVKTALGLKLNASALDTDTALAANSDALVPTQKATKAYVDQIVASQDAMVFKGVIDCSSNPNYPAADRGWTYRASVAGKIGGASGVVVQVGDIILCLTDATASGNHATVGSNWSVIQTNIDGALTTSDIGVVVQGYSATLAVWSGVTPGTGVAAALAINVGSAGAFVVFNGAGGTPSSLTLTNATGLPIAGLVSSTSAALGVGSLEIGHATDTTLARSSAGNLSIEGNLIYRAGGTDVPLADGGTGASLADPNADRIMFWDDSAGAVTWLSPGSNLAITGTTIDVTGLGSMASQAASAVAITGGTFAGVTAFTMEGATFPRLRLLRTSVAEWFLGNPTAGGTGNSFAIVLNSTTKLELFSTGDVFIPLPGPFANNAAAISGGLTAGLWYVTATGEPRIVV